MDLNKVKNHQVHYKIYCIVNKLVQDTLDKNYNYNIGQLHNVYNLIHVSVYKSFDYKKSIEDI